MELEDYGIADIKKAAPFQVQLLSYMFVSDYLPAITRAISQTLFE
jgi:hypothetical protein